MNRPADYRDEMIHMTLKDGYIRVLLLTATHTVQEAASIHCTGALATAALGRTLMGTAIMGAMLKDDEASVTVTIDGGGALGRIICIADGNTVRGCVDNPKLILPLRQDGKLSVGMGVGRNGYLTVVKDLNMKSPYVGRVQLYSGEIAEDFASYYVQSEQQPTLQSLGVLVNGESVLAAGGVLIQPLPGCPDEVISELELRSPLMSDISRELCYESMESLALRWFDGLDPVILERTPLSYRCNCSRKRMEKALIALGKEELQRMIDDEQEGAELHCHFCKKTERFSQQDLQRLLDAATRP